MQKGMKNCRCIHIFVYTVRDALNKSRPKMKTKAAPEISITLWMVARLSCAPVILIAVFFAPTAINAREATVMPVPIDIAKVDKIPATMSPLRNANVSTIIAPEHGRRPTARMADHASFTPI